MNNASTSLDFSGPGRTLLVASTGGHLEQLYRLSGRFGLSSEPIWVTFDHPQSRSLLNGKEVTFVPYIAPRDWKNAFRSLAPIRRVLTESDATRVVSTGSAIAVPAFLAAFRRNVSKHYIESVSRFDGPSLTGKMVSKIPGVHTYTQHPGWANETWRVAPSVLDDYSAIRDIKASDPNGQLQVLVTLGTIKPYEFHRIVDLVLAKLPDAKITWQLGSTKRSDLPGDVREVMSAAELDQHIVQSNVVVTHAGVGSALNILSHGKMPILATRLKEHGEHVDDHQQQITRELVNRGLAVEASSEVLSFSGLRDIINTRIIQVS